MNEIDKIYIKLNALIDRELGIEQPPLSLMEKTELRELQKRAHEIGVEKVRQEEAEKEEKSREMKRRRARGKYGERRLAKKVGGLVDGRPYKDDVRSSMFSYESKYVKEAPRWLQKVMSQAIRLSRQNTIPVACIRDRTSREGYFIIMEQDWVGLHGEKEG